MSGRPPKQEQERASDEVTEVAPGVLRAQLPIELDRARARQLLPARRPRRGGRSSIPACRVRRRSTTLRARLAQAGFPMRRIHTVIVTHSHHDHFGGAGRVRHQTGARLVTHRALPADVEPVRTARRRRRRHARHPAATRPALPVGARRRGVAKASTCRSGTAAKLRASRRFPRLMRAPVPDRAARRRRARSARRPRVGRAPHARAHRRSSVPVRSDRGRDAVGRSRASHDHAAHRRARARPSIRCGTFFESLDKVAAYGADVSVVLPAHGHPFTNLVGRVESIKQHHLQRLERLRAGCRRVRPARRRSVEFSERLFPPTCAGRWPTARPTPTSSTCAGPASCGATPRSRPTSTPCPTSSVGRCAGSIFWHRPQYHAAAVAPLWWQTHARRVGMTQRLSGGRRDDAAGTSSVESTVGH